MRPKSLQNYRFFRAESQQCSIISQCKFTICSDLNPALNRALSPAWDGEEKFPLISKVGQHQSQQEDFPENCHEIASRLG